MPIQCNSIFDIISKTSNLDLAPDNIKINAALIRQCIGSVINNYDNLFDLIDEFVTLVSDIKKQIPKLNNLHRKLISFDKIENHCYIVLQPNFELSVTATIDKNDSTKQVKTKIVIEEKQPVISTIETLTSRRDTAHYQYIDEAIKAAIVSYLEAFVDTYYTVK